MWNKIEKKIQNWSQIAQTAEKWQSQGFEIVFTNGCFDIMHFGHFHYLADAKACGDKLIVGLNSADSVRRLKGIHRPINDEQTRQFALAALEMVDAIVVFDQDTPLELIKIVNPDVLVKGGDWLPHQIVGSDWVIAHGGDVKSLPFVTGYSTTNIEQKIKNQKA